uniref:Uncharacterized protein n=1 Tax=Anguilla anguilla TaxID=7936 RepID=A0A0E9UET4_ANGAN
MVMNAISSLMKAYDCL